ncbi:MAG: SelB C-terminal domain-containing protein, partial [Synergistaceae bacterium]|nr:SelB C-terminal domain-containing protein [Synergistaceae bacterium]
QFVLEEPIVCTSGQRFIIRFYSPLITIGGGEIVFPYSYKPRGAASRAKILERIQSLHSASDNQARLAYLIAESGSVDKSEALRIIQDTPANLETVAKELITANKIVELDNNYLSQKYCADLLESLVASVRDYHKKFASESGIPLESLQASRALINLAVTKKLLVQDGNKLRTPDFVPENDEVFAQNKALIAKICMSHRWQLVTLDELKGEAKLPDKVFVKVIQAMKNSGELALIPEGYVLISQLENEMRSLLKSLGSQVTLAQVRDSTGSTRKFILPILEYFDSKGYTRRAGDYRVVL